MVILVDDLFAKIAKFVLLVIFATGFVSLTLYVGFLWGQEKAILDADPYINTERNVILIDFGGEVHEYEYYEE